MIVATGIDLVEVPRIERLLAAHGERFVARVLTPAEAEYCASQASAAASLAARFAAKEAVMKCLGTGMAEGVAFQQIEVVRSASGAVGIQLSGCAAELARRLGIARVHLSVTHSRGHAVAVAVAEG